MGRAFPPRAGCPVPSVSAITGLLVSSCQIDPPADPIFNFPIFSFPLPNPPSFNFGCYRPSARANVAFNQGVPYFNATVQFPRSSDTGNCQPRFNFDIGFPGSNCPDISTSAKIHLLPPGVSPSVLFSASKDPVNCDFKFKLNIGIPGGQCTSVLASSDDAGPDNLIDGDDFRVLTGFNISEDDSGSCTKFTLEFKTADYILDILDKAFGLDPIPLGKPACCAEFPVVSALVKWNYPNNAVGGVKPTLQYEMRMIRIPTTTLDLAVVPTPMTIPCGSAFDAVVGFDTVEPGNDCECGLAITPLINRYKLTPPALDVAGASYDGMTHALKDGDATVLASIGIGDSDTPCEHQIKQTTTHISAGGKTTTWMGVCDIVCTGSSIVVSKDTLYFSNGILTDIIGDCAGGI